MVLPSYPETLLPTSLEAKLASLTEFLLSSFTETQPIKPSTDFAIQLTRDSAD